MDKEELMPTYEYKCEVCGSVIDFFKEMGEDREPSCCGNIMTRIWSPTPVHFKSSGFYKTGG